MGELPTPNTSVNAVKFFKVEDKGYDPKTGMHFAIFFFNYSY
jgi:hypothetical protein